jgi:hypothetical protein
MKLLIKLAVVALLANAAWRLGTEYLTHYRFADSVQEAAIDSGQSDAQLRQVVLELAAKFDVPLTDEALTIRTEDRHRYINGVYVKPITILPGYDRDWSFTLAVESYVIVPRRQ